MNRCIKTTNVAMLATLLAFGSALAADNTAATETKAPSPERPPQTLKKFDLDFRGGHPKDLVAAIQKAIGKPLNTLIPDESANVNIPELKMRNVDVVGLFGALSQASQHIENYEAGDNHIVQLRSSYQFRPGPGAVSDDTIWSFHVEKPLVPPSPKIIRFYALGPYLDWGLSVDDITTAMKTGTKMLGGTNEPTISFHKDTRLLIAVGEPSRLEIIDSVLKALQPPANASVWHNSPKSASKGAEEK
jgi:hypothetical protein